MKNKLTGICLLISFMFFKPAFAQSNEVCGFVKHYFDKTPVAKVNLYIENTVVTTIADEAGAFCLNLTDSQNKIWVEKTGYFKTYVMAKAGDFISIEMIKNIEQELAVDKGLSIENIEALNTKKERGKSFSKDGDYLAKSALHESPTMSASKRPKMRSASEPIAPEGAPGPASDRVVMEEISIKERSSKISTSSTPAKSGGFRTVAKTSAAAFDRGDASRFKVSKSEASDYPMTEKKVSDASMPIVFEESKAQKQIKAGRLTAGEIHDFSKWALWNDLSENELSKYKSIWSVYPNDRYVIQAVTEQGFPIVDAKVELKIDNKVVWTSKTDNTGKAELWNVLFESKPASKKQADIANATVSYRGIENNLQQLKRFEEGVNIISYKQDCGYAKNVDIAFVVDATGSMGDEIDYLKVELLDVINRVQTKFEDLTIRLGNVFYRDKTDAYLTKNSPLTQNIKAGLAFIKDQRAGGGGDFPEAVDIGLGEAVTQLNWSNEAVARILFLVLDAPPHQNDDVNKKLQQTISEAAKKGIRIVPIVGSGIDKSTEYLLRSCALATNGHYVFLTDHSGIGGSHLKPSTDSYDVKNLNDLLVDMVMRYVKVQDCDAQIEPDVLKPSTDTKMSILPNPNDGRFLIKTQTDLKELFITDANGKILVRFTDFATGENQVDIANFPTGTYYVRYQKEGKVKTEKVIVKR